MKHHMFDLIQKGDQKGDSMQYVRELGLQYDAVVSNHQLDPVLEFYNLDFIKDFYSVDRHYDFLK